MYQVHKIHSVCVFLFVYLIYIFTPSYDEYLYLWDTRNMRSPASEIKLGGGIWRIKWEPVQAKHILTATMYNGFHVINTESNGR